MSREKNIALLLVGAPGSGKSSLAGELVKGVDGGIEVAHLSLGDTVRDISRGAIESAYRTGVEEHFSRESHLVTPLPDSYAKGIVSEGLHRLSSVGDRKLLLLDGYPRYRNQVGDLFDVLDDTNVALGGLLHVVIPKEIAVSRLLSRQDRPISIEDANIRVESHFYSVGSVVEELEQRGVPTFSVDSNQAYCLAAAQAGRIIKNLL